MRARARALREDGPLNDGFEDDDTGAIDSRAFFNASVAFYAVMTVGAQTLCAFADIHPDVIDGAFAFNVDAGALYTAPLLASLTFAVTQSEKYEFLREVRETFESRVLPATAPLGVVPQHDVLWEELTVREHAHFCAVLKSGGHEACAAADDLLRTFHLDDRLAHFGSELSGGMRRKLSTVCALAGGSKFVVLDEPTTGLDPLARRELWDLLQKRNTYMLMCGRKSLETGLQEAITDFAKADRVEWSEFVE